jgi:hypothetical protein
MDENYFSQRVKEMLKDKSKEMVDARAPHYAPGTFQII